MPKHGSDTRKELAALALKPSNKFDKIKNHITTQKKTDEA